MPSFFFTVTKPRSGHQFCGFCYTFLYERFEYCFCTIFGHGACPLGASTLPNMGKHVTPLGHVCCTDVAHFSPI